MRIAARVWMEELTGVDMIKMRQRKMTFALLALLLLFAACKAESPTAPTVGGGTPTGGQTPPTNASIALSASNNNPLVNSNVTITAKVTINNQNVPNGTAVQFATTLGTFTDTGSVSTLKITTDGIATATLTSAAAGTATVTATVNNSSARVTVTFSTAPVTPQPPSTTPTITAVSPTTGRPQGGEQVTITGTNFNSPVRVLFDPGMGATPKEAFVVSVSLTQIVAITPAVDVGTGQTVATDVIVLTQAGTPTEQRVVKAQGFTFAAAVLTPAIRGVAPTSGPTSGGTRVTIIGDAFQAPVQVFFGAAEAQVISVNFSQIIAMSPRASDTTDNGSGTVTGPVDIIVKNIGSGTSATLPGGFRYTPKMQITTAGPTEGPFTGGTRIRIDGIGFDDPLAVVVAGVGAQVISVSGSQVIAITNGVNLTGCSDVTGKITVTNTNDGDSADGPDFTFRTPKPLITGVSPNPAPIGGTTNITVLNALGFARISIGGVAVNIISSTANPDGTTTFNVQLPPTLTLTTQSCPAGGSAPQPTAFDVVYTSATTGCTDTSPKGITVTPAVAPVFFLNPAAFQPFVATITKNPAPAPPFPGTSVTPSASQTINLINTGTAPLTITAMTAAGAACPRFSPLPVGALPLTLAQCEAFPIVEQYTGQLSPATETCTVTLTSNAGTKTLLLVGTSQ